MKQISAAIMMTAVMLAVAKSSAYTVYTPPGNIVQNGNFQSLFNNWSGNIPAVLGNWSSVPNDYAALANDIYQVLRTIPGQTYSLSFYTAADLYLGPSVSVNVEIGGATLFSYTTPPYTYDPAVNRTDQMRWQQLTGSFTASSTTTRLELIDLNTYDFGLAAVSVVPIPEPTSLALAMLGGVTLTILYRRSSQREEAKLRFGMSKSASLRDEILPWCK